MNRSLAHQIMQQLRIEIIHGKLAPGERLVELDIARRMGTSQGPVREALQMLERDGLVERRARTASFVAPLSFDDMYELFKIRSLVESYAVRRAAQRISNAECDELDALVTQMRDAGERGDIVTLVECDMAFHRRLCEWSGSTTLVQMWTPLYSQIQRFVAQNHPQHFKNLAEIADTHEPIVAALRRRRPAAAARAVREHIMLIWSLMERRSIQKRKTPVRQKEDNARLKS
ncbi:MAG: GntR family transcriptional regulator [Anaerolineae bacterium]|nr:GntR family transcriptional regulator [Candidatus Roseilinea sp.]MDW8451412.1 GntR family transcriptional regulator [Anaerolineae bacterium]